MNPNDMMFTSAQLELKVAADEGQSFTLASPTRVMFGANDMFVEAVLSGNIWCDRSSFGGVDPAFGYVKKCYIYG